MIQPLLGHIGCIFYRVLADEGLFADVCKPGHISNWSEIHPGKFGMGDKRKLSKGSRSLINAWMRWVRPFLQLLASRQHRRL